MQSAAVLFTVSVNSNYVPIGLQLLVRVCNWNKVVYFSKYLAASSKRQGGASDGLGSSAPGGV